ncbi:hypothetical protein ACFXDE_20980 [Kitasatospora sp. NPDC059408]|uniref:hypothetical protein n=1 Tax=Kitasatospora sp. NPDC059408 TaxID=3346823 RepID=UPI0036CB8903
MPRFTVHIDNTETFRFVVEADDYEAAEAEALAAFESDARSDAYIHGHEPTVYDAELLETV